MWEYNAYAQIHSIEANLWAIDEIGKTILYVYEGNTRVLLLDTGFGLLDLKKLVHQLCPGKEIIAVNSHAHGDHNSGNDQFEQVCCGRLDEPFSHQPMTEETRKRFYESFFENNPRATAIPFDAWHPMPAAKIVPLADGDRIDLGGVELEVIEAPGHTIGSICLLDRSHGYLFTGDPVLSWQVWGQLEYSTALTYYAQTLRRLAGLRAKRIFPSHGVSDSPLSRPIYELPTCTLEVYADGTEKIVRGELIGTPFTCFAGNGLCQRFQIGGMVYDPNRIGNERP